MIKNEFDKFLSELNLPSISDDVKRIGNLIRDHMDELVPLTTYSGQRSKVFVKITHKEFESASTELPDLLNQDAGVDYPFKSLTHLDVGPFRGFTEKEEFDLNGRVVLMYGPNGSGKTSFCEALEYALLGSLEEAESKRLSLEIYLENARVGSHRIPKLLAVDPDGNNIEVQFDTEKYQFCFIEKNRIDAFSRMAANTPAQQEKLIAVLFGLGPFSDFVKNFSESLDEKYIDTIGVKGQRLIQKKTALQVEQDTLYNAAKDRQELDENEQALASKVKDGKSFKEIVGYLGTADTPGRIQELEMILGSEVPQKEGVTSGSFEKSLSSLKIASEELQNTEARMNMRKGELSFRDLYQAVLDLNEDSPDKCPACNTPLVGDGAVVENPYTKAANGVESLAYLSELEAILEKQGQDYVAFSISMFSIAIKTLNFAKRSEILPEITGNVLSLMPEDQNELPQEWWSVVDKIVDGDGYENMPIFEFLLRIASQIEAEDKAVELICEKREKYQSELDALKKYREDVVRCEGGRAQLEARITKAKEAVEQFDEKNKELLEAVEAEKSTVQVNARIVKAYESLVSRLNDFRKGLPSKLLADLGELVIDLYNGFNRHDPAGDYLSSLKLPLSKGQSIKIAFKSSPNTYFDALHVLSEGHIRCLGLAMLMAKNLKQNCPVLMFDDPVNAIDDDHREGLRRTMFEDPFFSAKQIILTCHGEDFVKDIQNLMGAVEVKNSKLYNFLPHVGDNKIKVDCASDPRNYVVLAEQSYSKGNVRESLAQSRRALESITARIWRFLANKDKGQISVSLRGPKAKVELYDLTTKLHKKLSDTTFTHYRKQGLIDGLSALRGFGGTSREWGYLNSGTHDEEDRTEFDRHVVGGIVQTIVALDACLRS
ncbi:MAG: AAA family ATPase [Sedimenticola sp.]